ncbi:hypothetical protein [Arthrobacter sp. B3I4]|uniref:hypothetical protein n=1 Tax=Arthrobacter sp. B3I4 TaxID=3042267 RepID=UPI002788CFB5|nr:hypothetical protein [Arthrobacter sp. B3I4]MDQ0755034.1 hypothetical protein [Arthrobacter sp. B3I4]
MTNSELPGVGSQQTAPHEPQQPSTAQAGHGAPPVAPVQQPTKAKKPRNVVGLIALIAAIVGFIFACVPGALIIGWILLPIAFILAIVSLFFKDKAKGMGIAALIISVVGTIVGVVVFTSVVATSFSNAVGSGETKVVQPSGATSTNAAPAGNSGSKVGTRENPNPIGSAVESKDWRIVVNSVKLAATDAVMAADTYNKPPAAGSEYILVNFSATYIGNDANGQMPAFVSVEYVTPDGKTINGLDKLVMAPEPIDTTSALYKGGTATGNKAIEVPSATAAQGVLAIRPGMVADKAFVAVK